MLSSSLNVEIRNGIGSKESNRLRNSGYIPGVVYGENIEPKNIGIDRKEFNRILKEYGTSVLLSLEVDGQNVTAMIKDVQRHPVKRDVIHVDFQAVSYNKPIHTTVPIVLVDREKVEDAQSVIQHQLRELHIQCLPQNIPESVQINVKDLVFGHPIKVADVEFGEDITVLNDMDEIIVSLTEVAKVDDEEVEEKYIDEDNITI